MPETNPESARSQAGDVRWYTEREDGTRGVQAIAAVVESLAVVEESPNSTEQDAG
jgi:hypothetical protein